MSGAVPPWLRGTLYRVGPGLWEVGGRQLRHLLDGFVAVGATAFGGPGEGVATQQRFVDNEPYRAARRGSLIVDKFASRRRFAGWGEWAQERIQVRLFGSSSPRTLSSTPMQCARVDVDGMVRTHLPPWVGRVGAGEDSGESGSFPRTKPGHSLAARAPDVPTDVDLTTRIFLLPPL